MSKVAKLYVLSFHALSFFLGRVFPQHVSVWLVGGNKSFNNILHAYYMYSDLKAPTVQGKINV